MTSEYYAGLIVQVNESFVEMNQAICLKLQSVQSVTNAFKNFPIPHTV
jgi:hypothetical protein